MLVGFLSGILSGIISGIIASLLLNWYYWNRKPRIKISNQIAVNNTKEYHIKIINKSRFYVTNIYIQFQLITVSIGNGGTILNAHNIDFPNDKIKIINPYKKNDNDALYALQFAFSKNLEEIWKEDEHTYMKLILYCSNEHNNSSKLYEQIYHKKKCIKHGSFKFGDSLEIEE